MPVRFMNRIMKKIVVRIGRKRLPSFLPSRSSAMLRGRSRGPSRRGSGTGRARAACWRVPSQKTMSSATTAMKPDEHDPVDLERRAVEQHCRREEFHRSTDRGSHRRRWTSEPAGSERVASSAISCFGAWSSALATTNIGNGFRTCRSRAETVGDRQYSSKTSTSRRIRAELSRRSVPSGSWTSLDVGHPGLRDDQRRRPRATRSRPRRG